jgi:hypothetical protein
MTFSLPTFQDVADTVDTSHLIWAAVAAALVQLARVKFPILGTILANLLAKYLPGPSTDPANPGPVNPVGPVLPNRPVLDALLRVLLDRLKARHGAKDDETAVAYEVAAVLVAERQADAK